MLCKKCNTENLLKADYCQNCGSKFTQEEKDVAYGKTIYGRFEKLEQYAGYLKPVELIKGNKFFRVGVLVVIVLYSLFMLKIGGNHIRIAESSRYEVLQSKETGAYYIVTDMPSVNAEMHIPRGTENLTVHLVDNYGTVQNTDSYPLDAGISLQANENYHYIIQTDSAKGSESIEVYVVMG